MEGNFISFVILATLDSIGLLMAFSILIFNIKFMKLRFIKMTSPRVNIFLIFGIMVLYTSNIMMILPINLWSTPIQTAVSQCRYWLLTSGFTITFGSMLVKGWRVHRLFQYPRANSVTIKDSSLFGGITLLLLLDLGILTSWQLIDPVTCVQQSSMSMVSVDHVPTTCSSEYYSIWMIILLIYKYILIVIGSYVGWQIRHITFPALDDSRCLLLGSGITLTLAGAITIIMVLFPDNSLALSSVMCGFLWLGTTAVLLVTFLPKVLVVYRASGMEPLMCSASKYVQQPVSNDIGTEIVKILGENRYLKRKLEERDTLVSHLKKKIAKDITTDSDSHQTSSANYSLSSTATTALTPNKSYLSSSVNCCALICFENTNRSIKATQGTPIGDRDLSVMSVKTVDVLTMPAMQEQQCHHSYLSPASLISQDVCGKETQENLHIAMPVTPIITVTHATANMCANNMHQAEQAVVDHSSLQENARVEKVNPALSISENIYMNDMDLLCSIANTYDLGGDSDTLSYISNCLHSKSSWSLQRRTKRSQQTLGQSATLGSDQLYPDSMLKSSYTKPKKQRRRQSVATSANVYVNDRGTPLII